METNKMNANTDHTDEDEEEMFDEDEEEVINVSFTRSQLLYLSPAAATLPYTANIHLALSEWETDTLVSALCDWLTWPDAELRERWDLADTRPEDFTRSELMLLEQKLRVSHCDTFFASDEVHCRVGALRRSQTLSRESAQFDDLYERLYGLIEFDAGIDVLAALSYALGKPFYFDEAGNPLYFDKTTHSYVQQSVPNL
jgi:hypothetical protein